jgi:flagellar basal-body rod protein FlgG
MSGDIYSSLSGAAAAMQQMELISQNIANSNTAGFKEMRLTFRLEGEGKGPLGQSATAANAPVANFRDGAVEIDGNPNHLALQGEGFFVVLAGDKEILSRVGAFRRDDEGRLTNPQGYQVMGESGTIEIPVEESFRVDAEGTVIGSKSGELGRLRIVQSSQVQPLGAGLWQSTGALLPSDAQVIQGALERSNVDPLKAMVELIEASRYFEAYQNAMKTSDEMDANLNKVGGTG